MESEYKTSRGIPQLLRLLADELENPNNSEMAEKTSQILFSAFSQAFSSEPNIPSPPSQTYHFGIKKGSIGTVAEVIWSLIELGKIVIIDQNGNEMKATNKEKAAEWVSLQLFGHTIKKWDQTIEAAFSRRSSLDVFYNMLNVARDKTNGIR